MEEGFLEIRGRLFYRLFRADKRPGEIILFLQGRNEMVSMYEEVGRYFLEKMQLDSFTYDVRGQGNSSGHPAHIDSFDQHLADLQEVAEFLKGKGYGKIHVVAHSTGALIAALFWAKFPSGLGQGGGLVFMSPFFDLGGSWLRRTLIKGLSLVFGTVPFFRLRPVERDRPLEFSLNDLTTDQELFEKFGNHRDKVGPPTWGWMRASILAQQELKKANFTCPQFPPKILILAASLDQVVSHKAILEFCQNRGLSCELKIFSGLKHALFQAPAGQRMEIYYCIRGYLSGF